MTVNAAWNIVNFRLGLVEVLLADGHSITILAPKDSCGPTLIKIGCRFIPLDMDPNGLSPRRDLALTTGFYHHFRRETPDLILSFTIKNNIFGAFAARKLGIMFVPNITGLGTAFLSGTVLKLVAEYLYKTAFRKAPAVFFQNTDDMRYFLARRLIRADQARLLPGSGIDLTRFEPEAAPVRGEAAEFLLVAPMLRNKGVIEYAEAARQVKAQFPDARFRLLGPLGTGNRSAINENTLAGWVSDGIVEYLGKTGDVRPFIARTDCVVLPSYREGAPRTLLESAAMARPVITTDVPGCRDVVDRDQTGYLCEVKSAASLSCAMIKFLKTPQEKRQDMGRAGRVKMQQEYDQRLVIGAYRDLIAEIEPCFTSAENA